MCSVSCIFVGEKRGHGPPKCALFPWLGRWENPQPAREAYSIPAGFAALSLARERAGTSQRPSAHQVSLFGSATQGRFVDFMSPKTFQLYELFPLLKKTKKICFYRYVIIR